MHQYSDAHESITKTRQKYHKLPTKEAPPRDGQNKKNTGGLTTVSRRANLTRSRHKHKANDPQKNYCLGTVSKIILLEGLNRFQDAPTSPLVQMWIKTHGCLVYMKDP